MLSTLRFWTMCAALPLAALAGCSDPSKASTQDGGTTSTGTGGGDAGKDAPDDAPPDPATGTVVFGVTSDLRAGIDVKSVHYVLRVDGEVAKDETLTMGDGATQFPFELELAEKADGAAVDVVLEAFGDATDTPLLTRSAATKVVKEKKLLVRVALEAVCVPHPGDTPCAEGETCVSGACADPYVPPGALETYTADWADKVPDICKPIDAGDPIVIVGQGQTDYLPIDDYGVDQVEQGPQGGYHIWLALRLKNLRHSGSVTEVTGTVPELGIDLPPFAVIFSFDQDEGGYCKLYGIRYQLDQGIDIHTILGKVIKVNVKVTDKDNSVGKAEKFLTLSDDYTPYPPP